MSVLYWCRPYVSNKRAFCDQFHGMSKSKHESGIKWEKPQDFVNVFNLPINTCSTCRIQLLVLIFFLLLLVFFLSMPFYYCSVAAGNRSSGWCSMRSNAASCSKSSDHFTLHWASLFFSVAHCTALTERARSRVREEKGKINVYRKSGQIKGEGFRTERGRKRESEKCVKREERKRKWDRYKHT